MRISAEELAVMCLTVGCVQPFRLFHALFAFCIAVTSDIILFQCKSYMYDRSFDISWSPRWHIITLLTSDNIKYWRTIVGQLSNPLHGYLTQLWFTSFHLEFSTDATWKQFKTDLFISVNTILLLFFLNKVAFWAWLQRAVGSSEAFITYSKSDQMGKILKRSEHFQPNLSKVHPYLPTLRPQK